MSHGTSTASVPCNEKKNWEILPFMCDDDESRSLAVEAHVEERKRFGGDQTSYIMWRL